MQELRVGLIGFGYIGKVHAIAYQDIPFCYPQTNVIPHLAAVLRSNPKSDPGVMKTIHVDKVTTQLDEFFAQQLDLVDICTPNDLHFEQVKAALERGIPVYCEKPLARSLAEAGQMADLAEQKGVPTHTAYMNRYYPAIRQMKAIIDAGLIGKVHTFHTQKFHSSYVDPNRPTTWRLRYANSGGGAMMDLGSHLVDLIHYLLGDVSAVKAEMRTIIGERPSEHDRSKMETVDVDDWALCTFKMASGAMGTLETTRLAPGANEDTSFEVYGSQGSLLFNDKDPHFVHFFDEKRKIWIKGPLEQALPETGRPNSSLWPVAKLTQGDMSNRHMASIMDFLLNLTENKPSGINFRAATYAQEIVEASYLSAAKDGAWINLPLE